MDEPNVHDHENKEVDLPEQTLTPGAASVAAEAEASEQELQS